MISAVLLDMQRMQSTTPFAFAENPVLRRFVLYDIDLTDDDTLYRVRLHRGSTQPLGENAAWSNLLVIAPCASAAVQSRGERGRVQ